MSFHHDAAPFGRRRASASGSRGRLHPGLCFQGDLSSEDNRLEIGESAVLARIVRTRGGVRLDFPGGEARAQARLAAAYMQPVSDQAMDALTGAARAWAEGEKVLAYIRLALAGLARVDDPTLSAYRLSLADYLLDEKGLAPGELIKGLDLEPARPPLERTYNPAQPREPKGSGAISGQWTKAPGAGADPVPASRAAPDTRPRPATAPHPAGHKTPAPETAAIRPASFVHPASFVLAAPAAEAGLGFDLAGATRAILLASAQLALRAATFVAGYFMLTSPAGAVVDGTFLDHPNLTYHWDKPAGTILFTLSVEGGDPIRRLAQLHPDGFYYTPDGAQAAKVISGVLAVDVEALGLSPMAAKPKAESAARVAAPSAAISETTDDNQPKLCPDPSPDTPHDASPGAKEYQASVTGLPEGLASYLNGVYFDGCRESNGVMLEAKGNYAHLLDKEGNWFSWVDKKEIAKLQRQIQRGSDAAGARGVEYHAKQERMALLLGKIVKKLELQNVTVIWNPRGERAR